MNRVDILIVGSGIAGLSFALRCAEHFPDKKVLIVTKGDESESNTKYAQGGISVVLDSLSDNFERHIADTLRAGAGLCDEGVVRMVVTRGPESLKNLINYGVELDKDGAGQFDLHLEGGHTANRILHHQDITGLEIERKLLSMVHKTPNIELLSDHFVVDLRVTCDSEKRVVGAVVLTPDQSIVNILSGITLLAAGGAGQVYENTTNPAIATGDGIAMVARVGVRVSGMEFVQFHPTALHNSGEFSLSLISEAVRGKGAKLLNQAGVAFMKNYDDRGELASRDIVARAIASEMKKGGDDFEFLDCMDIKNPAFSASFPHLNDLCLKQGIDASKDLIPIVPAAHYLCGGVEVDANGCTSIPGLLACGEVTHTGMHGANRLASNSLLEAIVYADNCFNFVKNEWDFETRHLPEAPVEYGGKRVDEAWIASTKSELRRAMRIHAGIVKSKNGLREMRTWLEDTSAKLEDICEDCMPTLPLIQLRNLLITAKLMVDQSLARNKNVGGFYCEDLVETHL